MASLFFNILPKTPHCSLTVPGFLSRLLAYHEFFLALPLLISTALFSFPAGSSRNVKILLIHRKHADPSLDHTWLKVYKYDQNSLYKNFKQKKIWKAGSISHDRLHD